MDVNHDELAASSFSRSASLSSLRALILASSSLRAVWSVGSFCKTEMCMIISKGNIGKEIGSRGRERTVTSLESGGNI